MNRSYRQHFSALISRFLARRDRKQDHHVAVGANSPGTDQRGCEASSGTGEPQPIAYVVDGMSLDMAVEMSKPIHLVPKHSGAGNSQKGVSTTSSSQERTQAPAPESINTECETVVDVNYYGELHCNGIVIGHCQQCGLDVCFDCTRYEPCPLGPKRWHQVVLVAAKVFQA